MYLFGELFMKKIAKTFFILVIIFLVFISSVYSEPAVDRAFNYLTKNLEIKDYEKSYTYSLFLINYFETENMPSVYVEPVKTAVKKYADFLVETEQWNSIYTVLDDTKVAPLAVADIIKPYVTIADKNIREAEEKAKLEKEKYDEQISLMIKELNENNQKTIKSVSDSNILIAVIFAVILLIFMTAIGIIIYLLIKTTKQNQIQLQNTILTMQAMNFSSSLNTALPGPLQFESGFSDLTKTAIEFKSDSTEDPDICNESKTDKKKSDISDQDRAVFANLILICKKYGDQIDSVTGRRNLSNRVAELVYKISIQLGYSDKEAMIFYAAGLIYDIGFINIDSSILRSRSLSEDQFEVLKTHTVIALNMIPFIDPRYQTVFKDAVSKHHENLDGTGYPNQLKAAKIPYIARVIHVVESYLALISSRTYKEISDRNEAISELRGSEKHYDQKIVDALDLIV